MVSSHIFPGCCLTSSTARTESASGVGCSCSSPRRITSGPRKGFVARTIANRSYRSSRRGSVHAIHSMSGEVDVAYSAGRRNGTSAPYQRATFAIAALSVETTMRSKTPAWRAVSIAYASSGCPASRRMFFSGTRSEPDRAPIRATALLIGGSCSRLLAVQPGLAATHHLAEAAALDLLLDLLDARRAPEAHPRIEHDELELARCPLAIAGVPFGPDAHGEKRLGEDVQMRPLREVRQG